MIGSPFFYHDQVYPYFIHIWAVNPGAEWPLYCWQVCHNKTLEIVANGTHQSKTTALAIALEHMNARIAEDQISRGQPK